MGLVYGMLPPEEDVSNPSNYLIVQVEALPAGATLDQYTQGLIQTMKQSNANLQIESNTATTLGGNSGRELVISAKDQYNYLTVLKVYTIKDGNAYIITYNTLAENYDYYLGTARDVIVSFEFLGAEKPAQEPKIETILPLPIKEIKEEQEEQVVESSSVISVGPSGYDYASIQEAINDSLPGDTIEVYSGTYSENINVTKPLTLLGIDDGNGKPVVDADGEIYAIRLSSDGIYLEGFEVINSQEDGAGIYVHSDDNFVLGNDIHNNGYGIFTTLFHGWGSIFENNTIEKNFVGIRLGSGSTIIKGNKVIENEDSGIILDELSSNNTIENNNVSLNKGVGIALYSSFKNIIVENTVSGNGQGGIITYGSGKNTINGNTLDDNEIYGIALTESYKTNVTDNRISGSEGAIFIGNSSESNTITGNNASKNTNGIYLLNSSGNALYQNRLMANARFNAYDNGDNQWDDGTIGNYYSGLDCIDGDRNDICDSEYMIPGGSSIDRHPDSLVVSSIALQPQKITPLETSDEVEKQIAALKDEDSSIRIKAAQTLGKLNDSRAIDPLIQALRDSDDQVKFKAAYALGNMGDLAVSALILALKDLDKDFRLEVSYALGRIGETALEPLFVALEDDAWTVRYGAADALGWINDPSAVDPLIKALSDENHSVSFAAAYALGKIGGLAEEPLIQALGNKDSQVRSNAAFALGKIQDRRAVEPLIQALMDEDVMVKGHAAEALGSIKDKRATEQLVKALDDKEWIVRYHAVISLGEIKDKRAVEPLIQALKDDDYIIRKRAADSLGEIGDPRAVDALKETLKDADPEVQSAAQEALEKIGSDS